MTDRPEEENENDYENENDEEGGEEKERGTGRNSEGFVRVFAGMLEIAMWTLTVGLMLVGFVGVIVPLLPGTTLILVAAIVHRLVLPADVTWMAVGFIALFWLVSVIADFAGVLVGTRWFGGSKWGMAGASGGALVGMFFSLPALVLGTVFGAVAAEKLVAKKTGRASLRSGVGAAAGFVISTVARLACAVAMIALFLASALSDGTVAVTGAG